MEEQTESPKQKGGMVRAVDFAIPAAVAAIYGVMVAVAVGDPTEFIFAAAAAFVIVTAVGLLSATITWFGKGKDSAQSSKSFRHAAIVIGVLVLLAGISQIMDAQAYLGR